MLQIQGCRPIPVNGQKPKTGWLVPKRHWEDDQNGKIVDMFLWPIGRAVVSITYLNRFLVPREDHSSDDKKRPLKKDGYAGEYSTGNRSTASGGSRATVLRRLTKGWIMIKI